MDRLERVARALVAVTGFDPEEMFDDEPAWRWWIPRAQAAIEAMEQWQPVETAPEDVEVLVYRPDGIQKRDVMLRVGDYWYWPDGESPTSNPTHWQALPEPPK